MERDPEADEEELKALNKSSLKKMLKAMNLPEMPYKPLADRLNKEHNDYTGNMTIVRGYKRRISAAAKRALKDPTVGRISANNGAVA